MVPGSRAGDGLSLRDILDSRRAVDVHGVYVPPRRLRYCGVEFQDDAFYLESARKEAARLSAQLGFQRTTPILDLGCGTGRLATGILSGLGEAEHYRGVDVSRRAVRWCRRFISKGHPGFVFLHTDVRNERYNPEGEAILEGFRLPFAEGEFAVVYAYSVFSHMRDDDVRAYLREFHRVTSPQGRLFFTAFAEEGVPDVMENPPDYRMDWGGSPLHCVRYNRAFLAELVAASGFAVDRIDHGTETNGQSAVYASKRHAGA